MPATFQSPIAPSGPSKAGLQDVFFSGSAESNQIVLVGVYMDGSGNLLDRDPRPMTPAQFQTQYAAATGPFKQRIYTIYLNAIGQSSATVS